MAGLTRPGARTPIRDQKGQELADKGKNESAPVDYRRSNEHKATVSTNRSALNRITKT